MANSSSVNKLLAFNGSFQSNDTGACKHRFAIAADRTGVRNCLETFLDADRSILNTVNGCTGFEKIGNYYIRREGEDIRNWTMLASEPPHHGNNRGSRGGKKSDTIT